MRGGTPQKEKTMARAIGTMSLMINDPRETVRPAKTSPLIVSALLLITLATGLAHGTTFRPKDFDQLVGEAEQIFVGTVTTTQSRKKPTGGILTEVTFGNLRMVKGSDAGTITLEVMGGTVGKETLQVSGVPVFRMGMRYLVFMAGNGTAIFPVVGGNQGVFQVTQDQASGADVILDAYGASVRSPSIQRAIGRGVEVQAEAMLARPAPILLDTFLQAVTDRLRHP
jgi:hypothetical protein